MMKYEDLKKLIEEREALRKARKAYEGARNEAIKEEFSTLLTWLALTILMQTIEYGDLKINRKVIKQYPWSMKT